MTQKKSHNVIIRLLSFSGSKKIFIICSCILSALSAFFVIAPFIFLWLVIKEIIIALPDFTGINVNAMMNYAWLAVGSAILGFIIYYLALLSSHTAAFTVSRNIKSNTLHHLATLPLSFFTSNASGKVRKIIDENADATETFIAHQMPDFVSAMVTPVIILFFCLALIGDLAF